MLQPVLIILMKVSSFLKFLIRVCLKGQFALRKWVINDQKLQTFIEAKENENIVQNSYF